MKNLFLILSIAISGFLYSNPMWTIYDIKVENPQAAANIISATDELMASSFAQENFKGSLHLNAYQAKYSNVDLRNKLKRDQHTRKLIIKNKTIHIKPERPLSSTLYSKFEKIKREYTT